MNYRSNAALHYLNRSISSYISYLRTYDYFIILMYHVKNALILLTFCVLLVVCRLHYIEYLVGLIGRHKLDPISILDLAEVSQELRRRGKELPERPASCTEHQYRNICAKVGSLTLAVVCQCAQHCCDVLVVYLYRYYLFLH